MKNDTRVPMREMWRMELRAWRIFWKRCPELFISIALSALFKSLAPYVTIWFSARLIGELAGGRDSQMLARWALATLLVTAAVSLISAALQRWKNTIRGTVWHMHEQILIEKFLSMDFVDADSQWAADLYEQIMQNVYYNNWGIGETISQFETLVTSGVNIAGGVGLTVNLFTAPLPVGTQGLAFLGSPLFAAATVAVLFAAAACSAMCCAESDKYWGMNTAIARRATQLNEYFIFFMPGDRGRALDLRMYEQQENVGTPYLLREESFGPHSWLAQKSRGPMGAWAALTDSINMLVLIAMYLFVCLKAWAGAFGVGMVTQYLGAATNLFAGISQFLRELGWMRSNGAFLRTEYEFLDIPNKMYQGTLTTEKRADRQYEVEFRDVSFRYPGREEYALRHVNIKFKIGRRLAVVGRNGSGKTTFIKLLCRLYDPTEGEILLNGINIRKYRYDNYMDLFSVVFQDFKLFSLELGQNVAAGETYEEADVRESLEKAGFGPRLSELPQGIATSLYKQLDENGVEISGGEAQKIAIARALYKNAPFIILDEPTAALDPIAEAEIYSKFDEIAGDRTAIYISHRLSSCKFCDEIAVFDGGAIVQQGTHEALLAQENSLYGALWNAQAQYYV